MKKLVFIMLANLMLSACKTTTKIVEVPVEVVKKEYIHNTKIDSVYTVSYTHLRAHET